MQKKISVLCFSFLTLFGLAHADPTQTPCSRSGTYFKLEAGSSFPLKSHVSTNPAQWDASPEGYDANIGIRPIIAAGFGYEFCPLISSEILFSYRPNYSYKKYQTSFASSTPGFAGTEKTRRFNLTLSSLLLNFNLSGCQYNFLSFQPKSLSGTFYPLLGAGVGVNQCTLFNFRSTGLPPVGNDPSPTFSSDNAYSQNYRFCYQLIAGIEYRRNSQWALSTGYRWFDSGRIRGPKYIRLNDGQSSQVDSWRISLAANELFFALKYFL